MRTVVTEYLRERGYDTSTAGNYDSAMDSLAGLSTRCDRRPMSRDCRGARRAPISPSSTNGFPPPSTWRHRRWSICCTKVRAGPISGSMATVIKKPFPIEALGEALRERIGHPRMDGHAPGIDLDLTTNTLRSLEREAHLTNIEATLLAYLIEHEGEILHPRELLVDVWQYHDSAGASTLVRAHVSNLRRKLRDVLGTDDQIQTIRGKGYRFSA